jgi:hypothetical protein
MADLYAVSDRPGDAVLRDLHTLVSNERANTALLLARLAEVDARRLYVPAAYSCLLDYCMGELGFTREAALKRIRVARTAHKFPALYPALAQGRLNLTAVLMLAAHLTDENAAGLLDAAVGLSIPALEQLLADRFPRTTMPLWDRCPGPKLRVSRDRSSRTSQRLHS